MRTNRPVQRIPAASLQDLEACRMELEEKYPGYLEENTKLTEIVKIMTGVRLVYGIFSLFMFRIYGLSMVQGIIMLLGTLSFYCWYMWMLRSGRLVAVFMLAARGYSIISGGTSLLTTAGWLPYPLIFVVAAACVIEFIESVFCIYVLFNAQAAQTVCLNRELGRRRRVVAPKQLRKMAEYQNSYEEDPAAAESQADSGTEVEKETGKNNS